jgi:hypothetical protein
MCQKLALVIEVVKVFQLADGAEKTLDFENSSVKLLGEGIGVEIG